MFTIFLVLSNGISDSRVVVNSFVVGLTDDAADDGDDNNDNNDSPPELYQQ